MAIKLQACIGAGNSRSIRRKLYDTIEEHFLVCYDSNVVAHCYERSRGIRHEFGIHFWFDIGLNLATTINEITTVNY